MISSLQRPLPDNTQQSQQTNIHAPGGIRTHDLRRQVAADLRLRPHGHWDRLKETITESKTKQERFVLGRIIDIPLHMIYDQTVIKMWHVFRACHICELPVGAALI